MLKIRFVRQQNRSSGCGPACIAMISSSRRNKSESQAYADAVELIFGKRLNRGLYTQWSDLRGALKTLGIPYANRIHRHRRWDAIETMSIVKCGKMGKDGENWHWVIYDGTTGVLYDPLREAPTRPNGRTRMPRSHLPIGKDS